jgi:hypothetical protein
MSGPRILSLDQSLARTGWARSTGGQDFRSGSWPLSPGTSMRGEAYRELWAKLAAEHRLEPIDVIAHEAPVFGAVNKGEAQLLATIGMIGVIELFAINFGIEVVSHAVQSWRSTWFHKDERKLISDRQARFRDWKGPALARALQYGFDCSSHDQAEAIAIHDHHLLKICKVRPPWREAQLELESVA